MPSKITQQEEQRRQEGARTVLQDAGDDVQTVAELNIRVGEAFGGSKSKGKRALSDFLNSLPPGHALRQKFEAIKMRSASHSVRSAFNRQGQSGADSKSLVEARQERAAYEAARRGLSMRATAERLRLEFELATKATAVSAKKLLEGQVDCACVAGLRDAVNSFETAVMIAGSVRAVNVAPNGHFFVRKDLVEHAGQRWDDFKDKQAASIRQEEQTERNYQAATQPVATVTTFPKASLMESAIKAARIPHPHVAGRLRDAGDAVLRPLYVQAQAELAKNKRSSRAAKTKGDKARHASAADAYGGAEAVLRPPVAVALPPGHFVRSRDRHFSDDREENIEKIADDLEIKHKFVCPARVVVRPERASDEYGRLAPSSLDVGAKLQLAKILLRLKSGRFMIAAVRSNGEPILLVVGRGMCMDIFVGIRAPPIEAADAATRLRSTTGPGDAGSHKNHLDYRSGAARMVATLRRVIIQMRLSGGDVAALVDRIMDQIDGRCEDLAAGEAPTRGGVVPIYDSGDEGLGECPSGVDAADWAILRKGSESNTFVRLALASDFAAAASGLLKDLRGGAPGDKCSGNASDPVAVPTGGEAPPVDDDAAELPAGSKRTSKKDKFARGQEADADRFLDWKFGPLDFDWATKANVTGAPAWARPIEEGERLVDFWLRFSKPMAESIPQKYVVLHSSDAAPADISGLVAKVDQCAAARKADAGGEPAAKRARTTVPV